MVQVTVKRSGHAERVFDVATTAELLEKVDKSRHFFPGGTLEDSKGVVLGSSYPLKEGAEFDWFPSMQGFVRKLTAQERVNALVKRFGPELRQRLEALPKKAAKRSGPITGVPTGRDPTRTSVPLIGQHFPLHGFEAPVKQAFQLFCDMDYRHVRICDYDKPQLHPNILKFVAAPGMGKTTALGALGPELYNYMWKHKDVVTEVLETRGSLLHKRVFSSLQPSQPLVFTLDLKGDLDTLVREEQDLSSQEILALRMLLSTLRDNATAAQYRDLLEAVGQLMPKGDLQPLDVLLFVQAAMGLEGQHSMAIFAWDEVNAVKPSRDSETSWVQEALSASLSSQAHASDHPTRL